VSFWKFYKKNQFQTNGLGNIQRCFQVGTEMVLKYRDMDELHTGKT